MSTKNVLYMQGRLAELALTSLSSPAAYLLSTPREGVWTTYKRHLTLVD
jgi:hypothetical protein